MDIFGEKKKKRWLISERLLLRQFYPTFVFLPRLPFFYPALRFFTPPGLLGLCVRTMISQLENVSLVMGEDSDFDAPLFVVLSIPCILASSTR